ncbi:ArnT family glycosyltransferase [Gulosibacter sediminis]|uniref:ArnT family glycosyltransferase n=1 Tax=Gulosibacter sediminis TaxID=1729695 RepID=UPI0018675FEC|nr:phospholipid carrier-dependent glycosyltransferase [Gulosibacter sediminis]
MSSVVVPPATSETAGGEPAPPSHGARRTLTTDAWYRLGIAGIGVVFFVMSLLSALNTPYFDGPDEHEHVNSVSRLVDGGGWPLPYEAPMQGTIIQAQRDNGVKIQPVDTAAPQVSPEDRGNFAGPARYANRGVDAMVQHPPAYYLAAAGAVWLAGGEDLRWDHAYMVIRGTSALFMAGAIPFIIGGVRWATGRRTAGLLGGAALLLVPFFSVIGGYASNDTLLTLSASATMYFLLRYWRDPEPSRWLLPLAGVAYGVALLTKGFALFLGPTVVFLALLGVWRHRNGLLRGILRLAVPAVIAVALGGWWWVRNYLVLGTVQPSRAGQREHLTEALPGYDFGFFVSNFFERLNNTFWARGALPEEIPQIAAVGVIIALVVALWLRRTRVPLLVTALYLVITMSTIFVNAHAIYFDLGDPDRGVQGRYLFSGLITLAIAVGAVWLLLLRIRKPVARAVVAVLGVLVPLGVNFVTVFWLADRRWLLFWQSRGALWERSNWRADSEWYGAVPHWLDVTLMGVGAVACVLACVAVTKLALAAPRVGADAETEER